MSRRNRPDPSNGPDKKKPRDARIDHLLKRAFRDDLPPDAEKAMKRQLERFQTKMEQRKSHRIRAYNRVFRAISHLKDARWTHFLLRKEALIAASLLMVIWGAFIQSYGSTNRLAENLSVLGTSVVVASQTSRFHSMECAIQLYGESGRLFNYSILWLAPNMSKIQITRSDDTPLKTIWLSEEDIVIADHSKGTLHREKYSPQSSDRLLQPIVGFLSPQELAEQMYGDWTLKQYRREDECGEGIFTVALPNERAALEVTVDLCTYLPVTVRKIALSGTHREGKPIMNVHFRWGIPLSPEFLSPPAKKENQNG